MLPLLLYFILHHPLLSTAAKKAEEIAGSSLFVELLYRYEYICLGITS